MDILATGTGRCGTGYLSKLLTSVNLNCTHEGVFNPQGWEYAAEAIQARRKNPHWGWRADSSWLATPFLQKPELFSLTVIHIVRHPKRVMDSNLRLHFYTHPHYGRYFNWMRRYLPELDEYETPQDKGALWYIRLNQMAEARADIFYRVEDSPIQLLDLLGVKCKNFELYERKNYNSRAGYGPSDVKLPDICEKLRIELLEMAERYRYEWNM